jgi:hypothetical protein
MVHSGQAEQNTDGTSGTVKTFGQVAEMWGTATCGTCGTGGGASNKDDTEHRRDTWTGTGMRQNTEGAGVQPKTVGTGGTRDIEHVKGETI